jgi:PIN domain nuclease of toxin-antitoxin system
MGGPEMMKLLLDTHIFLWSLLEPKKLTKKVRREVESIDNQLWLSPITTWETMILVERGRVILEMDPRTWISDVLKAIPFREAPINHEIAMRSRTVSLPHQDPADRFLAATAAVYDLTLVTADERLLGSDEFSVLPNV